MTQCSLVHGHSVNFSPEDDGSMFLRNADNNVTSCSVPVTRYRTARFIRTAIRISTLLQNQTKSVEESLLKVSHPRCVVKIQVREEIPIL